MASVPQIASSSIDARIASSTDKAIYSTLDHAGGVYVRNAACWAAGLTGLTSFSPWNSVHAGDGAGVLITRAHVIAANHYSPEGTIRFVDASNNVHVRTLQSMGTIANSDVTIFRLVDGDGVISPLPAGIDVCRVLPSDWSSYLFSYLSPQQVPVLFSDKEKKALVGVLYYVAYHSGSYGEIGSKSSAIVQPVDSVRLSVFEEPASGDSGSPMCLVIGSELVLFAMLNGSTKLIPEFKTEINNLLANDGDYALSEFSFERFDTMSTNTYNANDTFAVPAGCTSLVFEVWGTGGKGADGDGGAAGCGGGAGGYVKTNDLGSSLAGVTLTITVPAGSAAGTTGTSVKNGATTICAASHGGDATYGNPTEHGTGGGTSATNAAIRRSGAVGGDCEQTLGENGGGGGGSGTVNGAGTAGSTGTLGAGGDGGLNGDGGASGGGGGAGAGNASAATAPGGGGGGGGIGGLKSNGATGRVIVTYTVAATTNPLNRLARRSPGSIRRLGVRSFS